ncbi:Receptor-like cytosolic serine/threonine-protein kinase RBK2 [Morella rubra]|uniref:Receptor-like cytosolic serine/threonine-protein kinase RBK2 n=1 Tax=Morella rubra TaxID=262757 RepID=A0A6A1V6K1_9ROSI|nr:Receptor-like cytosolic serine/threonine-protein kinase RBK2 [Morella rubra]
MTVEEEVQAAGKKKVLVDIRMDCHSRELLTWALLKVAEPGDCVVAIHVARDSHQVSEYKNLLDGYLEVYEGLCKEKKVDLTGQVFAGSSVRKALVREAKSHAAAAVVVGICKQSPLRYHVGNRLVIMSVLKRDLKPSFPLAEVPSPRECRSEFGDSEAESEKSLSDVVPNSIDGLRPIGEDFKDEIGNLVRKRNELPLRQTSLDAGYPVEQKLGWPLLRRTSSSIPQTPNPRKLSVVQWAMSLPDRSPKLTPQHSAVNENLLERGLSDISDESIKNGVSESSEIQKGLEHLSKTHSSGCKMFSLEVLKTSTSQFSSANIIGKGGFNRVYKGILPDGKPVAVKILKSTKEASKDFSLEVDIISSLKHKNITPLLGICTKDNALISVYEFLSKGSLEENLHGGRKDKCVLSWEDRFNIAVGIAEALNHLHNECSRPVIHRDVKSSNILLSEKFEPQLSDFGLAMWGPKNSSFVTEDGVVGTFGYLAPEYFMYGKVSDKIDVYAFGVVLLELLSGRKSIGSDAPKGQDLSLVMWAKPVIESGDVRGILDPNLDGKHDEVQLRRMVLAATLCITRSARLRPKMIEILKLLKGENCVEVSVDSQNGDRKDPENHDNNDDEVYPKSSAELHLSLALLDVDGDTTSQSSVGLSSAESSKGRCSRSSSFD